MYSKHCTIGEGTIIMHDVIINAKASVGFNCIINNKALIEHDAKIAHNSTFQLVLSLMEVP